MGKTRSYKKAHSAAGGSQGFGANKSGSRPPSATHGSAGTAPVKQGGGSTGSYKKYGC